MSEEFSTNRTDELKAYGFKPGIVVSYNYNRQTFGLDDIKASLFGSTYSNPKTVLIRLPDGFSALVAIDTVKAVEWKDGAAEVLPGVMVYPETPEWYAEGWIQNRSQRVRLYLAIARVFGIARVYVQTITDVPEADDLIYHGSID